MDNQSQKTFRIQSKNIFYTDDAYEGLRFLRGLSPAEIKVYFDQAYLKGEACFEDHAKTNFKLVKKNYDFELIHLP